MSIYKSLSWVLLMLRSTLFINIVLTSSAWAIMDSESTMSDSGNASETESDSIVLQPPYGYCRGSDAILTVTGENVTWYADSTKTKLLARGNTYHSPPMHQNTTFYLTQTIDGVESPVKPVTVEMLEAYITSVAITPDSCEKKNGTITINATGGTVRYPLRFQLNDEPEQSSSIFSNLSAGTYKITVRVFNCWGTSEITVGHSAAPQIVAIDSVVSHCGGLDGALTISSEGGIGTLSYSLDGVDFKADNRFDNLKGGVYTVFVRDQSLCTVSQTVSLGNSVKLKLDTINVVPTSCGKPNGEVKITSAEGNGKITYSLTGKPDQLSNTFRDLEADTYTLSLQDEEGCTETRIVVVADSEGPVILHVDKQAPTCGLGDGSLKVSTSGSPGQYYSLDGVAFQQDPAFSQLSAGEYTLIVRDESMRCEVTQVVALGEPCESKVSLPSSFSPNQDGVNDNWMIFFPIVTLKIEEIIIFNRWGEIVFYSRPGDVPSGYVLWDGKYKSEIQKGLFTYKVQIQFSPSQRHQYQGSILVL